MKNTFFLLALLVGLSTGCSSPLNENCTDCTKPLSEAEHAIKRYNRITASIIRAFQSSSDSTHQIIAEHYASFVPKSFFIPRGDFVNFVNQPEYKGARVYMGLECGKVNLYLVPVTANNGRDTLLANDRVYDFVTPCPAHCDSNNDQSPLNIAADQGLNCPFDLNYLSDNPDFICTSTDCGHAWPNEN